MNLNINTRLNLPPGAFFMHALSEIILATIPGAREDEQLEVALCQIPGEGSKLELRQQTWGEGIGWYTQSRVRLDPQQVGELRGVLGFGASANRKAERLPAKEALPQEFSRVAPRSFVPRVVRADSA
jgi:hypothetical protein